MLFVVHCLDKPFSAALRSVTRDDHLKFVAESGPMVKIAGPFLSDDGTKMIGSLLVIEAEDLDAARAWQAGDPYQKVGLFDHVEIRPWRWLVSDGAKREEAAP